MSRRMRRWFTRPGPRYCSVCSQPLDYSILVRRDTQTGKAVKWQWAAACPASSVVFTGIGSWSGNGHARTHTLIEYAGPPTWAPAMARALAMRKAVQPGLLAGYGERLREGSQP